MLLFFAFNTVYSEIRFSLLHRKVYSIQKQLVVIMQASHDIRSKDSRGISKLLTIQLILPYKISCI